MRDASRAGRISRRFDALAREGRAALVTFVTAGDPDLDRATEILLGLPGAGADLTAKCPGTFQRGHPPVPAIVAEGLQLL